jgi:hypothetical protein
MSTHAGLARTDHNDVKSSATFSSSQLLLRVSILEHGISLGLVVFLRRRSAASVCVVVFVGWEIEREGEGDVGLDEHVGARTYVGRTN